MKNQDLSLLILTGIAFLGSMVQFFFRRAKGSSRAISTFTATFTFGCIIALGFLIFTGSLLDKRGGMGLERYVIPPILAFISLIISTLFGLTVYIFENRKKPTSLTISLKNSSRQILKKIMNSIIVMTGVHSLET
jgi:hypothetical protein